MYWRPVPQFRGRCAQAPGANSRCVRSTGRRSGTGPGAAGSRAAGAAAAASAGAGDACGVVGKRVNFSPALARTKPARVTIASISSASNDGRDPRSGAGGTTAPENSTSPASHDGIVGMGAPDGANDSPGRRRRAGDGMVSKASGGETGERSECCVVRTDCPLPPGKLSGWVGTVGKRNRIRIFQGRSRLPFIFAPNFTPRPERSLQCCPMILQRPNRDPCCGGPNAIRRR